MAGIHLVEAFAFLRYMFPVICLIFFLAAVIINASHTSEGQTLDQDHNNQGPGGRMLPKQVKRKKGSTLNTTTTPQNKLIFVVLSTLICCTSFLNGVNVVLHSVIRRSEGWWCGKAATCYIVGAFIFYSTLLASLVESSEAPSLAHLLTWSFSAILELILLVMATILYMKDHKDPLDQSANQESIIHRMSDWEFAEVVTNAFRIFLILVVILLYTILKRTCEDDSGPQPDLESPQEYNAATSLLAGVRSQYGSVRTSEYGTESPEEIGNGFNVNGSPKKLSAEQPCGWERREKVSFRGWLEYVKGYTFYWQYLWPFGHRDLQSYVVLCLVIMILQRILNLLVPYQAGRIIDVLSGDRGVVRMPWLEVLVFILFTFLRGGGGILEALRAILWLPVSQYSYRELSVASFTHVNSLGLDFHLSKKTGEVISALSKGNSINTFLEIITFNVLPTFVDLLAAMIYLLVHHDVYYTLDILVVTFIYFGLTIRVTQWRAKVLRKMTNADRDADAVQNDSLVSYETVKYFNAEAFESKRYHNAVKTFQAAEYKANLATNLLNVSQNLVFTTGLLVASMYAAWQISNGYQKVGQFVSILTLMGQLQQPLDSFGQYYKKIQSQMINAERMLELFKLKPNVVDDPSGVTAIHHCDGDIIFDDVHFAYNARQPGLQGLSFHASPGTTTAIVGSSGNGKTTIFRLLYRFYNAQSGSILLDGRNVRTSSIDSLRRHIGIVPQDIVLFNDTIMYNLKYANEGATDEQVYEACRAADIHERILTLPEGYRSQVGERGLKLSGGEKQRMAIARTILKDPRVILLDEATAALDAATEEKVQEALGKLGEGRTMLVIAHRLSTVTRAEQILYVHEGQVKERGTHGELLELGGMYADMWAKQAGN